MNDTFRGYNRQDPGSYQLSVTLSRPSGCFSRPCDVSRFSSLRSSFTAVMCQRPHCGERAVFSVDNYIAQPRSRLNRGPLKLTCLRDSSSDTT